MLTHPTLDQMQALGLAGMATALSRTCAQNNSSDLSRDEWLGPDARSGTARDPKRLTNRLAASKLRFPDAASRTSTLPLIVVSTAATLCRLRKGRG
ncbi:hypothetical protein [Rhizobium beringeri]|uniref:hypothetical protein n=1 Tax=Rhizobium beringeri TaxID=3019934 RepID=UPI003B5A3DD6